MEIELLMCCSADDPVADGGAIVVAGRKRGSDEKEGGSKAQATGEGPGTAAEDGKAEKGKG